MYCLPTLVSIKRDHFWHVSNIRAGVYRLALQTFRVFVVIITVYIYERCARGICDSCCNGFTAFAEREREITAGPHASTPPLALWPEMLCSRAPILTTDFASTVFGTQIIIKTNSHRLLYYCVSACVCVFMPAPSQKCRSWLGPGILATLQ